MIPTIVADLAQLLADWDSVERNDEHISMAYWLIENMQAKGYPLNV